MDAFSMLANEVKKMVKALIDRANYDKTIMARITNNLSNNKYKVKIKDKEYTATSISSKTINIGDTVYVTICNNNYNTIIIL